jgi:hypothetical protein
MARRGRTDLIKLARKSPTRARLAVMSVLNQTGGNVTAMGRVFGITQCTAKRWVRRFKIDVVAIRAMPGSQKRWWQARMATEKDITGARVLACLDAGIPLKRTTFKARESRRRRAAEAELSRRPDEPG